MAQQDFRKRFEEQLDFLRSSCAAFDQGKEHEAARLATAIRILVHDKGRNTSLLTHLGVKSRLGFLDRGPALPGPIPVLSFGLATVQMTTGEHGDVRYKPALDRDDPYRIHPPVSFVDWWTRIVLEVPGGETFARSDFVLSLCEKDGGAHVDGAIGRDYAALTRFNAMRLAQDDGSRPISNGIVPVSVRHIAGELLQTIDEGISWQNGEPRVNSPVCPLALDEPPLVGRNDPCPCESGKKMKRCFGAREALKTHPLPPEAEHLRHLPPGSIPNPLRTMEKLTFATVTGEPGERAAEAGGDAPPR